MATLNFTTENLASDSTVKVTLVNVTLGEVQRGFENTAREVLSTAVVRADLLSPSSAHVDAFAWMSETLAIASHPGDVGAADLPKAEGASSGTIAGVATLVLGAILVAIAASLGFSKQ